MHNMRSKVVTFGTALLSLAMLATGASAQVATHSRYSSTIVGVNNGPGTIYNLDGQFSGTGAPVNANAAQSFTGLDRNGNEQTMDFEGSAFAQSNFGQLRANASTAIANTYYNFENPIFSDVDGNLVDPNGSPTFLGAAGFASFTDTLQFGGALQSGYTARYLFRVDGTLAGDDSLVNLNVKVDNNPGQYFETRDTGLISTIWATNNFAVNGTTPQSIEVVFSAQINHNTPAYEDGSNVSGAATFASTLTLDSIEVYNGSGQLAGGWTVTSSSGTVYNTVQAPEPASLALVLLGGVGLAGLRRRKK